MKLKLSFATLSIIVFIFIACEEENTDIGIDPGSELTTLIADEVVSDINFADLLDEGDNGMFWGDGNYVMLKSAEIEEGTCPSKQYVIEGNKKIVTFEYSGEDCPKSGTIIIEYFRPTDDTEKKKKVFYIDFKKNGITYNGEKEIVKGGENYNIEGRMEIDKVNEAGDSVHIVREFHRQIHWLCGLDTPKDKTDNIKKVTGHAEFDKTVNGETKSYSRHILEPLLIVKACDLRIQAGTVKVEKADGSKIKIDYGQWPDEINCESEFECDNTFEVTKGDKTYQMELIDGKRVRVKNSEE